MNCLKELKQHYGTAEGYALYRLVMEECFGLTHTDILLGKDNQISEENQARLLEITGRLLKNEPVQYVLGYADFCGHRFAVRPGVLIPRPETELLVQKALELGYGMEGVTEPEALDIGTGSGCIAVSMALAGCRVTAMDISEEALEIAMQNATALNAEVAFVHENILQPSRTAQQWHVIVSNPPYICLHEAEAMERNVLDYEPHNALGYIENYLCAVVAGMHNVTAAFLAVPPSPDVTVFNNTGMRPVESDLIVTFLHRNGIFIIRDSVAAFCGVFLGCGA